MLSLFLFVKRKTFGKKKNRVEKENEQLAVCLPDCDLPGCCVLFDCSWAVGEEEVNKA